MPLARSKITTQGQISVPLEIRRKLGVGPGSILEWEEDGGQIIVRRSGTFSSQDIHRVAFPEGAPPLRSIQEIKESIRHHALKRYARR